MELHCLHPESPTTTTTTASACSCSTDPPYDNCPPFAQRLREREVESRLACPAVTGPLGPCSPPPALAPAAVPTVVSGGRGGGAGPDHCYCSWRGGPLGGPGWEEAVLDAEMTKRGGGGGGAESCWAAGVRARENQSPEPSQSEQHRSALSLYDNIPAAAAATATPDDLSFLEASRVPTEHTAWPPEPIRTSMDVDEGLTDDQSTWSSCEIILTECNFRGELEDAGQDRSDEQEPELDYGFNRGGSLSPSPQQQPSPAGLPHQQPWSPRVPPPVPLADPSASALRSVLTSLQQQIVRQREEYEARILSLEQRNEELQVEVVRLKTNLVQQRHWYQAVQAKIVESEKARASAELRNATLQREMEQLFDTFGELNNEAKKTECIVKSF